MNFHHRLSAELLILVFSIEAEPDESLNFGPNTVASDLGTSLDEGWLSSSGDLIEDGTNLENTPTLEEESGSDYFDQMSDSVDIAVNQCASSSSPLRKLRKRGDACESFFRPGPNVKFPDLDDIYQKSKQNEYCRGSQWATFGNIPVCAMWPDDINPMTHAVLGNEGPLALPLNGWASVYGYLCKCFS